MRSDITFCPEFLVRPMEANHSPPRLGSQPMSPLPIMRTVDLQMAGATATVSTLVTVVGHPKTPTSAGNGGFSLRRSVDELGSNDDRYI